MNLQCYRCRELKPIDQFHKNVRSTRTGKAGTYCKPCMYSYRKDWESKNKDKRKGYYDKGKYTPKRKVKAALGHSNRSELDFDWVWGRLEDNMFKCEITGIPFTWGYREPTGFSIDRIDPNSGYTKDNVRFICWWLNVAMSNWGLDRLKELIKESRIGI